MLRLDCRDLHVARDGTPVLAGVSLSVSPGEWLSVIGPNGAGKTTMIHALAGLISHRGEVAYNGRPSHGRHLARQVALVPQHPVFPPGMSVADYVILGRTAHLPAFRGPGPADRDLVAALIDDLDLGRLVHRSVLSLSGGERQRCILARALAQQAPLLLLDEPTTGLDLSFGQQTLDLIERARARTGVTVVSTMHDLTLANCYSDRLALLAGGKLVAHGRPEEVLTEPLLSQHYGGRLRVVSDGGALVVVPVAGEREDTGGYKVRIE